MAAWENRFRLVQIAGGAVAMVVSIIGFTKGTSQDLNAIMLIALLTAALAAGAAWATGNGDTAAP